MCFSVLAWLRYSQAAPHRVEVCPLEGTLFSLLLVRLCITADVFMYIKNSLLVQSRIPPQPLFCVIFVQVNLNSVIVRCISPQQVHVQNLNIGLNVYHF